MNDNHGLIHRLTEKTVRLAAFVSGLALLWLMALTIVAVVMRYVFNAPLLGAQDLSEVSLILVVFPAMAYCGWTGGHVALDLISSVFTVEKLRWSDCL
ncbi:MAG: TRAP transporter small permease, partial [Deltaproteobacteria bacterium]|nr:TRAP transporter small permease [Deltaproteobacteria bacterium]